MLIKTKSNHNFPLITIRKKLNKNIKQMNLIRQKQIFRFFCNLLKKPAIKILLLPGQRLFC